MNNLSIFFILIFSAVSTVMAEETYRIETDGDGVRTIYNQNIPAEPDLRIELTKIATITRDYLDSLEAGRFDIYDFENDKDGNIIILDYNRMWKFSSYGKYINRWSRKGYGPGEIINPFSLYLMNDTIHVPNHTKVLRFDNTGEFINDIPVFELSDFPHKIFAVDNDYIIGSTTGFDMNTFMKTDRIIMYDPKTILRKKTLFERTRKKKGSMFSLDDYFLYAGYANEFFVVDNSYNEYKIDCFDSRSGKLKYKIRKNHIRVKNDEEVQKHLGSDPYGNKLVATTGDSKLKESVNQIYYDKYKRLWVDSNNIYEENPGIHFDIFKDGIFLNRVKLDLPIDNPWGFQLTGDRFVIFDNDDNVYFYEFK